MIAYKFRSSAQIAFAFDIITQNRLYCSDWRGLNDPLEGAFGYKFHPHEIFEIKNRIRMIKDYKLNYKICSLSETYKSHLLWSHYAGGFDGVAIEVELPDDNIDIRKVKPRDVYTQIVDMRNLLEFNEEEAVREILFSKYKEWEYEQEIRILNRTEYFNFKSPVRKVIAGPRMNDALFDVLNIVCAKLKIALHRLEITKDGIDTEPVEKFKSFKSRQNRP